MQKTRLILTGFILLFAIGLLPALEIDPEMVVDAAKTHLEINKDFCQRPMEVAPEAKDKEYTISEIIPLRDNAFDDVLAYVVTLSPKGFVVISSNTDIEPVIFYSFYNDFPFENSPINIPLRLLVNDMIGRIDALPVTSQKIIEENNQLWSLYLSPDEDFINSYTTASVYGPWIDTRWGQKYPYHMYCPIDPQTHDTCVSGCTAVSIAQIINYWEYPPSVHFESSESYLSDRTSPGIWIDATTANMDTIEYYSEHGKHPDINTIAKLMWASGVSVRASYSSTATGAWFWASTYKDKWHFTDALEMRGTDHDFYDILQSNMRNAQPAQLAIYDSSWRAGHSIVADGYKETGVYHLNFGWTGFYDGWYSLPIGMPVGYEIISKVVVNIKAPPRPDITDYCVTAFTLKPEDEVKLKANYIEPAGDADWYKFQANKDSAYIFYSSGPTEVFGEIYATCNPSEIPVIDTFYIAPNFRIEFIPPTSGTYYIKFRGLIDSTVGAYSLHYYRNIKSFITVTFPNGGEEFYEDTTIAITWDKGGIPRVYNVKIEYSLNGPSGPWNTLINSTPTNFFAWTLPEVTIDRNNCYVRVNDILNSNIYDICDSAFTIKSSSIILDNIIKPTDIQLVAYPNPFNSYVNISFYLPCDLDVTLDIYNVEGKRIETICLGSKENGNYTYSWEVPQGYSSGILFIQLRAGDVKIIKRIVYIK